MLWLKMGQYEIFEWMKENPNKWFNSKEIAEGLDQNFSSVITSLKKIRDHTWFNIEFEELPTPEKSPLKKYKYIYYKK